MATRGTMGVRLDGVDHMFYNHFDSYPSSLGASVVEYIHEGTKQVGIAGWLEQTKDLVRLLTAIKPDVPPTEEQKKWCVDLGVANDAVGDCTLDSWDCLLSGTVGNLALALSARFYGQCSYFLKDGLFCEYAYIVNLDEATLEFYAGLRPGHEKGRAGRYWANVTGAQGGEIYRRTNGYGPVSLVLTFPIKEILASTPAAIVARMTDAIQP